MRRGRISKFPVPETWRRGKSRAKNVFLICINTYLLTIFLVLNLSYSGAENILCMYSPPFSETQGKLHTMGQQDQQDETSNKQFNRIWIAEI